MTEQNACSCADLERVKVMCRIFPRESFIPDEMSAGACTTRYLLVRISDVDLLLILSENYRGKSGCFPLV